MNTAPNKTNVLIAAWVITLLASILPEVMLTLIFKLPVPDWLLWFKLSLLAVVFLLSFFWRPIRPVRRFALLLFALLVLEYGAAAIQNSTIWSRIFPRNTFTSFMASQQVLRVAVALVMAAILMLMMKNFSGFYLVKGDLNAEAAPIPLIMSRPTHWVKLGWILALCISGGTLFFLVIGAGPTLANLGKIGPLVPVILLFAAMNSLGEEVSYRAGFLAVLVPEFGKGDALLLTAILFGMDHFYGVPYGIAGVVMATILGWLLGKAMVETKGFAWAWLIHFF